MKLTLGVVHGDTTDGWFIGPFTNFLVNPKVRSLIELTDPVLVRSGPDLAMGRGHVVGEFLEHRDGDALLMLDSDMAFTPQTIVDMWQVWGKLLEQGHQILGGLAFILGGPKVNTEHMRPNIWMDDPEKGPPFMCQVLNYPRNQLLRVAGTGAACLMIGREVLDKMRPNPFAIYNLPDGDRLSEDLSMCRRARDLGFEIHHHTGIKFDHAKTVLVGEDDYLPALEHYEMLNVPEEVPV